MSNPNPGEEAGASSAPEDVTPSQQSKVSRRRFLKYTAAGVVVAAAAGAGAYYYLSSTSSSGKNDTVVIAWPYQINDLHPYRLNHNGIQESPMDAIYDRFILQDRNLQFQPGVVSNWSWGSNPTSNPVINMTVRSDVKFHDGTQLTADDIAFSLQTAATQGFAYAGVWGIITNITVNSSTSLTLQLSRFDPGFPVWFGFLDAFIVPKAYYQKVGADGFATAPISCGPYKFVSHQNGILKLQAFSDYWQGAAPIPNAIFKEVTDPSSRASEVQSGTSDITQAIDTSVFKQLSSTSGLKGAQGSVSAVSCWFVSPYFPAFKDAGVRQALNYAIDRNSLVQNVLGGIGQPDSLPEEPGYQSWDPNFNIAFDANKAQSLLQAAGYSASNPLNLPVLTTNGAITGDYNIAQACAQMWKNVGINVNLQTMTEAQYYTYRSSTGTDAALLFNDWSNSTGDPEDDIGYIMSPNSPFSMWAGMKAKGATDVTGLMDTANQMLTPVFTSPDNPTRYAAGKAAAEWAVNNGLLIPLYMEYIPIVMKSKLNFTPWPQGWMRPYSMSWST
ncbi:MAG TPA: ABC transporter substrate-binding protein [Nitrososphaerales archaeon]|nr:ABC transporter substrate-binding protein [Nitrososphaerales archaeon]